MADSKPRWPAGVNPHVKKLDLVVWTGVCGEINVIGIASGRLSGKGLLHAARA